MSKIIYIVSKDRLNPTQTQHKLTQISHALEPENIVARPAKIAITPHVAYGIINPESHLLIHQNSVLLGKLFNPPKATPWYQINEELLDGSFALFRENAKEVQILSDPTASKTIWYYHDEDYFIASTSQRAIIMFLGSFELDLEAIPWMLSTGTLGPTHAWDRRIKRLPVDSNIVLNKANWHCHQTNQAITFAPTPKEIHKEERALENSLRSIIKHLKIDFKTWRLPLSGGYDSRGLLALFYQEQKEEIHSLKTVTWGLKSVASDPKGDAHIAKKVAQHFGVPNQYYPTETANEPIERIVQRFLLLGEGRIENINGYMDGFALWKQLYEDGVEGIIRGDEGFGWSQAVSSQREVRYLNGCALCSDFENLKRYSFATHQRLPQTLQQSDDESLEVWRDRLHHLYRLPTFSAALSDLKSAYMDVLNPILSRKLLQQIRTLPEPFRDRTLFERIVDRITPKIEFATNNSIASHQKILSDPSLLQQMLDALNTPQAKQLFPKNFLKQLANEANTQPKPEHLFQKALRGIARLIKGGKKGKRIPKSINPQRLLFRVHIILGMNDILTNDAGRLKHVQ